MINNNINILVIGRHQNMMEQALQMLEANGYNAFGELENEKAIQSFKVNKINIVVIGGGVDDDSRALFYSTFLEMNKNTIMIHAHPTNILQQIKEAIQNKI